MNRKLLTIVLIALSIAGVCAFLVAKIVGARMSAAKPVVTTKVVAAATDIQLGAVLAAKDLTTTEIQGPLPKGVFLKPEELVGRGVISPLYQGEPILESRLAPPGSGGGMASIIPHGHESAGSEGGSSSRSFGLCDTGHAGGCSCIGHASRRHVGHARHGD